MPKSRQYHRPIASPPRFWCDGAHRRQCYRNRRHGADAEEDPMNSEESFSNATCEDALHLAESELTAFIGAVTQLFGPAQARLSAEEWLDESDLVDSLPRSTSRDWRAVTVAASARLANRLTAVADHRTSPMVSPVAADTSATKASPTPSDRTITLAA